jgi:glycosyltransferase involved in cell wall biosynthesis
MRVALVHDWLVAMRGGEKCLEAFCELFPDAELFTLIYEPEQVSTIIRKMKIHASWIDRLPWGENYFRYLLPLFPSAIQGFQLAEYDLVLSSSHCVAKGVFPGRTPHISYVHTPMRYVWDLHDAYLDGQSSLTNRVGLSLFRHSLQRWDVRSSNRVDFFIANSRNVSQKIARYYGRESLIVFPPVDQRRFRVGTGDGDYYLIVSALVPYKRIDIAVDAFNSLSLPLKIVGAGPLRRELQRRASSNIEFRGSVDDPQLEDLYSSCRALIFPGEEDFGIVPLEAQMSGRPVIGFGRGGLLETVIGLDPAADAARPTGLFFDEPNVASLVAAVRRFETSRERFIPEVIRAHALKFNRDRFQREITAAIDAGLRQFHGR